MIHSVKKHPGYKEIPILKYSPQIFLIPLLLHLNCNSVVQIADTSQNTKCKYPEFREKVLKSIPQAAFFFLFYVF